MYQLKLVEASKPLIRMKGETLFSPACDTSLDTFQRNIALAQGVIACPGWSAMIRMQWEVATQNAAIEIGGPGGMATIETWSPNQIQNWTVRRHVLMAEEVQASSPLLHENLEVATRELDEIAMCCGEFVHGMMSGLLKSMCLQAWSAIEVLIEGLHNLAIESHPECFTAEIKEKQIRTRNLAKGRFFFTNREKFRDAYSYAFGTDPGIDDSLGHESIDALVSVRNLIVHKAGIVDLTFLRDQLPQAPSLNSLWILEEGKELEFDGCRVHTLVDAAVGQGFQLIRAVNDWLAMRTT